MHCEFVANVHYAFVLLECRESTLEFGQGKLDGSY